LNTSPSDLPEEQLGLLSLEDLDFHLEDTVRSTELHQFGSLIARQAGLGTVIDAGLVHPAAQTAVRDAEILGNL